MCGFEKGNGNQNVEGEKKESEERHRGGGGYIQKAVFGRIGQGQRESHLGSGKSGQGRTSTGQASWRSWDRDGNGDHLGMGKTKEEKARVLVA